MISLNTSPAPAYHASALIGDALSSEALQTYPLQSPSIAAPADSAQTLKTAVGERNDLKQLAHMLRAAIGKLPEHAEPEEVALVLKETLMPIDPESSFRREQKLTHKTVSLETFIQETGIVMPVCAADLMELAWTTAEDCISHPLGNFAGALSWALPLSLENQREVSRVVAWNSVGLEGLPLQNPRTGALGYLTDALPLSASDLQDPAQALEKLLASPRALALGEAIQAKINGIATQTSVNDYLLAAIHLGLDPESFKQQVPNSVAGFDLSANAHFGKSATEVARDLAAHLIAQRKTSNDTAAFAAHLLLARVAPQFLVKDIPTTVDMGSLAWTNLCLAAARIEAKTPGKAMSMSFGDVMLAAQSQPPASEAVQKSVLMEWAVANQVTDKRAAGPYLSAEIEHARQVFNRHLDDSKAMSQLLAIPMCDRRAMALTLLKAHFTEFSDEMFEQKALRIDYGRESPGPRFSDPYSMLEITMQGLKVSDAWKVIGNSPLDLKTFIAFTGSPQFNVPAAFEKAFATVTGHYKNIKQNLMMNAITHLPLEDRNHLNWGELRFFQENTYRRSFFPFVADSRFHSSTTILVQSKYAGEERAYAFDTAQGTLERVHALPTQRRPVYVSNEVTRVEEYSPGPNADALNENRRIYPRPNHFRNQRMRQLAGAVVKGLEIDSEAVKRQAAGRTSAEQRKETLGAIGEFFLDLIPLRSAIVSLGAGNYRDAATDLAFDVFGFVTAGLGTTGKLSKLAGRTGTALGKIAHGGRIIGATTFSAFNPLGGAGDLAVGAGKLALQGLEHAGAGIKRVRGMATVAELADASKRFESAATGRFKVGENTVEGSAILRDGRWYAYDGSTQTPYGTPLVDFKAEHTLVPPAPPSGFSPTAQVSTQRIHRHHPYKRPGQTPYINATASPAVTKTDHLAAIQGEYVMHIKGAPSEGHFTPSRRGATEGLFKQQMDAFYQNLEPLNPPSRPVMPTTQPYEKVPDLIEKALDSADVVIFGESHQHLAMFRAIDENIELFKRKNVKVVGIEGMVYYNNGLLKDDGMGLTGPGLRPAHPQYNLQSLIEKLTKAGIEVVPLDHVYLTRHRHDRNAYTRQSKADRNLQRLKEFNYYATRELEQHKHKGKVLALVGRQHINTTQGVAGLAEATGGIGIGVYERTGMRVGYGTNSPDPKPGPLGELTANNDLTGDLQIFAPGA